MSNDDPNNPNRISRSAPSLPGGTEDIPHGGFARGAEALKEYLKQVPFSPGVYRMVSANGDVLYVGKAKSLKKRVTSYTQIERLSNRIQRMVALTHHLEIVVTHTEAEALLLEANFIRHYQPPFNVLLRDDKSYPYILITKDHDFPQLVKYRGSKDRDGWYFGPFASSDAVNETMGVLMRGFMIRNCSDSFFAARKRPCLQYHIKRCTAPCVAKVSKDDYARQVQEAREFLLGKNDALLEHLQQDMQRASAQMDFEEAAHLRDRIRTLATIQAKQNINLHGVGDVDVVAIAREAGHICIQIFFIRNDRNYGNRAFFPQADAALSNAEILSTFLAQFYSDKPAPKQLFISEIAEDMDVLCDALKTSILIPKLGAKKGLLDMATQNAREALARRLADRKSQNALLEGVAACFGLPEPAQRIEVYDNSHTSGTHAVGAMIVAGVEGFIKKAYRKFNIKDAQLAKGDDYGMMREMLRRRFTRLNEEADEGNKPDLVLIDGGMGQLNAALETLAELGLSDIPVVGIAKGPDRNAGRERFFMQGRADFQLEARDPVLYFLQRLRDESHRFVIGSHRARRVKAISNSPLDGISGIGPTRKKKLLLHFGSAQGVAKAGLPDLMRVPGINAELAKLIYDYFHSG
ncbi:MAG: excinuclease ABC subunit UvrC [Alphaproteobacteria bacterium]|nr:excinuclease ABC subunit UvrC [Alphaproteobacteria bacterium]